MTLSGMRALVVEDERSWQLILGEILTDSGLVVDVADSLEMALTLARLYPHRLAVVDLSLQDDDPHNQAGLQVLAALGRFDPGCVKILLTGFATVELAVSVLTDYGAFTCLRKEAFNRSQFRALVQRALASAQAGVPTRGAPGASSPGDTAAVITNKEHPADKGSDPLSGAALVVEDDAGWRSILFELLVDAGHQVRLCNSYGEALGCLLREKYQLAVIDLSLVGSKMTPEEWEQQPSAQDLEGYRLLTSTRANGIPTIVVSGISNPAEIEKTYQEQGVFAFMEKQFFDRRAFLRVVQEAHAAVQARRGLDVLTDREREVFNLLTQGMTNREIADTLYISTNTVKRHLKAIFDKLDIHTRTAAAARAFGAGGKTS
jgi:DNA-binding NarL/FixJ family response regulator